MRFLSALAICGVLASSAFADPSAQIQVRVEAQDHTPLAASEVYLVRFTSSGPEASTFLQSTTDGTGVATLLVSAPAGGIRYEILVAAQGYVPGVHAQYTNPSHAAVYVPQGSVDVFYSTVTLSMASSVGEIDLNYNNAAPNGLVLGSVKLSNGGIVVADGFGLADGSGNGTLHIYNVPFASGNKFIAGVFDPAVNKSAQVQVLDSLSGADPVRTYNVNLNQAITQTNVQNQQQGPTGGGGLLSVQGVVIDAQTSRPIPWVGINYSAQYYIENHQGESVWISTFTDSRWAQADNNGRFEMYGLRAGTTYYAQVNGRCDNGACYEGLNSPYTSFGDAPTTATGDFLYEGALISKIIALEPAAAGPGEFLVKVEDDQGHPLPQSWVSVWPDGFNWHKAVEEGGGTQSHPGLANANVQATTGYALVTGLLSGNYTIGANSQFSQTGVMFNAGANGTCDGSYPGGGGGGQTPCGGTGDYRVTIDTSAADGKFVRVFDDNGNPVQCASQYDCDGPADGITYANHSVNFLTIRIPIATATSGVVKGMIHFPRAVDLNADGDSISIFLQPQNNSGGPTSGGYLIMSGVNPRAGSGGVWGPDEPYSINVEAGQSYWMNVTSNYWGLVRDGGGQNVISLVSTGTVVKDFKFAPAGRIMGKLYTPKGLFRPTTSSGSGSGDQANINAQGQNSWGWTQVLQDGSYQIGGLLPGKYTLEIQGWGDFPYTSPLEKPRLDVTAGRDSYLDVTAVNGTLVMPDVSTGTLPKFGLPRCEEGDDHGDCPPENWVTHSFPSGTRVTNDTLRGLLDLTEGGDHNGAFGIAYSTSSNGGGARYCNGPAREIGWCASKRPSPANYDFYFIRAGSFDQKPYAGTRPYFVIHGSSRNVTVDDSKLIAGAILDPNSFQEVIDPTTTPPTCRAFNGPGGSESAEPCRMGSVQKVQILPPTQVGQATLAGAVSGLSILRKQDFDTFGGDFNNFMKYIPIVTLYDSSGALKAGGAVLPKPSCLGEAGNAALDRAVNTGDWTLFNQAMSQFQTCSGSLTSKLGASGWGFEIRGLPTNQTFTMVLTSPNYAPLQRTVTTGVDRSTTTLAAINMDTAIGNGATLITYVKTAAAEPVQNAVVTIEAPNYPARSFTSTDIGTVTVAGLPPANYTITAQADGYAQTGTALTLSGSTVYKTTLTLVAAGGSISGSVYYDSPTGRLYQPGVPVYAYDDTLNLQNAEDPNFVLPLYKTLTSTTGVYNFSGLVEEHEYKLFVKVPDFFVINLSTPAKSDGTAVADFELKKKPLDIEIFGQPVGDVFRFLINNPSNFRDGAAWISTAPFTADDEVDDNRVDFHPINDTQLALDIPLANLVEGVDYALHIQAEPWEGDSVIKEVTFGRGNQNNSLRSIDSILIGDDSDTSAGARSNEILLDDTGDNGSALTIPAGAMIPISTYTIPTCSFRERDAQGSTETNVLGGSDAFASGIYDITMSSVDFTDRGFDITLGYDPTGTNLSDLDVYVYSADTTTTIGGLSMSSLRPNSVVGSNKGKWVSLKALGLTLVANPLKKTITVKGIKSLASVLRTGGSHMAATRTALGYRTNTNYRTFGLTPNENGSFAVLRTSRLLAKPSSSPSVLATTGIGVSSMTFHWAPVARATGYNVYPSTGGDPIAVTGTSLTFTDLLPNKAYGGKVAATNNQGVGPLVNLTTTYTLAEAPTNLQLVSVNVTTVTLSWDRGTNPAITKYLLSRYAVSPLGVTSATTTVTTPADASAFTLTGLKAMTTYYFNVRALNFQNKPTAWDPSISISTQTDPVKPATPASVAVLPANATQTSLLWTWKAVPGATHYQFFPSTGSMIEVTTTSVLFTDLTKNSPYSGRVRAKNATGYSALSASATFYTLSNAPTALDFTAVNVTSITVHWNLNGNTNTKYAVSRWLATGSTTTATTALDVNSYTFTGLVKATTYYINVRALNLKLVPTPFDEAVMVSTKTRFSVGVAGLASVQHLRTGGLGTANMQQGDAYDGGTVDIYNFPNPFNLSQKTKTLNDSTAGSMSTTGTVIKFAIPAGTDGHGWFRVYNVAGELVAELDLGDITGGFYYYRDWDGKTRNGVEAANGVYFGILDLPGVDGRDTSIKMTVIK